LHVVGVAVGAITLAALSPPPAGAVRTVGRSQCARPSGSIELGVSYGAASSEAERAIVDGYRAGIDDLNRDGGLAGCRVEMVAFRLETTRSDVDEQAREECTAFTQVHHVLAVFSVADRSASADRCYADARTPVFTAGNAAASTCADATGAFTYLYAPAGVATCRFGPLIGIWDRAGLFPDDAKVGIVAVDDASGQNRALADELWARELRARGVPFETMIAPPSSSPAGFSESVAAVSDGLAGFMADGVNVVVFAPSGGEAIAAFMPAAAARNYFPAYGLTSADGIPLASTVGSAAIRNALAISWLSTDLTLGDQQALPANASVAQCARWATPSETAVAGASPYCDFLNILRRTMARAKRANAAALRKGVEALGTTFVSSLTYDGATKFRGDRHDGAYRAHMLTFDTATSTFRLPPGARTTTIP
jgi:ABC-type branched-subunit amino acid transport system substrate-binding protein